MEAVVPRISMFFGIVVFMYFDDHAPPHFHILYEGEEAVFGLDGALMHGHMAARVQRLVREWAELRHAELTEDWNRARNAQALHWIEPL